MTTLVAATVLGSTLTYLAAGSLAVWLWQRLNPVPPEAMPSEGVTLRSDTEGFSQEVLRIDRGRAWVRLTMDPHAPGPPAHLHTGFPELLRVTAGRVTVDLEGHSVQVGKGEEFLIAPGTVHRLRNTSGEPAVVEGTEGDEYALPMRFLLFLVQAYEFFDASPENGRPPRALLQMAFWSPLFDTWLAHPPVSVQRIIFAAVRPLAFLLGYRPWYARFNP